MLRQGRSRKVGLLVLVAQALDPGDIGILAHETGSFGTFPGEVFVCLVERACGTSTARSIGFGTTCLAGSISVDGYHVGGLGWNIISVKKSSLERQVSEEMARQSCE